MNGLYIIGASGHAKAVIDLLEDKSIIAGVYDDNPEINNILGIAINGPTRLLKEVNGMVHIAIGDNRTRKKLVGQLPNDVEYKLIVHKSALVSNFVKIGQGTVIMEGAIIKVGSKIGHHVIVNTSASIDHDCWIDDFVHVGPGSTLCGNVRIGEGTLVGARTVVIPGISIGNWCTIGAGSVVHKDVPHGAKWIGSKMCI